MSMDRSGALPVRVEIILDTNQPEQSHAFKAWAEAAGLDLEALNNEGCGCCVDIYTFETTPELALALDTALRAVGTAAGFSPDPT
ncbi:hypothetical protein K7W42_01495 [Deinococcus sp. HMF7604]|uniref:hypothetical protein n=1 Tax=Deinococcus betulae TaxID=2873312 RepID=UPI001CCAEACA|nr:hypothetical protein [Deinococcus betulae]MBZ9749528.1 hypothetical protein [Deinococcus betulae]